MMARNFFLAVISRYSNGQARLSVAVCSHGCAAAMRFSQLSDLVRVLERQPDVVEAFEQAHAVGGRNVERDIGAAGAADALGFADRR